MTRPAPVSVRLDPTLNHQVEAVAAALDRPKSWVIEQALKDFGATQAWQLAAIDERLQTADAGRVIPQEQVDSWVRSWGQPDERPMLECG